MEPSLIAYSKGFEMYGIADLLGRRAPILWSGMKRTYDFIPFEINGLVVSPSGGGVYVFSRRREYGDEALYVGETDDFQRRLKDELSHHHRWPCLKALGVTHVGIHLVPGARSERLEIETDLRLGLDPPCNRQ